MGEKTIYNGTCGTHTKQKCMHTNTRGDTVGYNKTASRQKIFLKEVYQNELHYIMEH
jgi:hypothetical protein